MYLGNKVVIPLIIIIIISSSKNEVGSETKASKTESENQKGVESSSVSPQRL